MALNAYTMKWYVEPPTEADKAKVAAELEELLADGLDNPEELIFHNVFLGESMYGPSVVVWGMGNDPGVFHCEYTAETKWETVGRDDD